MANNLLRNYHLLSFGVVSKNIDSYLKRLHIDMQLHTRVRLDFLYILILPKNILQQTEYERR